MLTFERGAKYTRPDVKERAGLRCGAPKLKAGQAGRLRDRSRSASRVADHLE